MTYLRWIVVLVTSVVVALAGCSSDSHQNDPKLGEVKQTLTGDQARLLGLEDPADYAATPSGAASLSQAAPLTQGSGAVRLAHPDQGWSDREIEVSRECLALLSRNELVGFLLRRF